MSRELFITCACIYTFWRITDGVKLAIYNWEGYVTESRRQKQITVRKQELLRNTELAVNQIRILHLDHSDDFNAPLTGHLQIITLKSRPSWFISEFFGLDQVRYDALSYAWGDPTKTHSIQLGDLSLPIHKNLHEALLHLRARKLKNPIWTDAICIRQDDAAEKLEQIQMMYKIYNHAYQLWAWLGPSSQHTETAISRMPQLIDFGIEVTKHSSLPSVYWNFVDRSPLVWNALLELISNAYFDRLWVAQEITAARRIRVICGPLEIAYNTLAQLSRLSSTLDAAGIMPRMNPAIFDARNLITFEAKEYKWVLPIYDVAYYKDPVYKAWKRRVVAAVMGNMLLRARTQSCTHPEDRIYAIQGMINDYAQHIGVVDEDSLLVFCGKPTIFDMYVAAFAFCLEANTSLLLLGLVEDRTSNENEFGLPSWCPNFHKSRHVTPWSQLAAGPLDSPETRRFTVDRQSRTLMVQGRRFAYVEKVIDIGWQSWHSDNTISNAVVLKANLTWLLATLKVALHSQESDEVTVDFLEYIINDYPNIMTQVWTTLIGDFRSFENAQSNDSGRASDLLALIRALWSLPYEKMEDQNMYRSLQSNIDMQVEDYFKQMHAILHPGTKSFVTKDGAFGIGPASIKPGDVICGFEGGLVPYALSEVDGQDGFYRYTFTGEVLVFDLQRRWSELAEYDVETFHIV